NHCRIFVRIFCKIRCGDENSLFGALSLKCAGKLLDFWTTDSTIPAFCLNIDNVQSQTILVDHTVNSAIPGLTDRTTGILARSAITHCYQKLHNELLEKSRRTLLNFCQQVDHKLLSNL